MSKIVTTSMHEATAPKGKLKVSKVIGFITLVVVSLIMLLPPAFMLSTALKEPKEVLAFPPTFIPNEIVFRNFIDVWSRYSFLGYYRNSIIVAVISVAGTLLSSSFVAFGFSRYASKWKKPLFSILLATMMLPYPVTMIPQFLIFKNLGWVDSFLPLTVPAFVGSAYMIFMLRQFFASLTDDLFDAARIDGCTEIRQWWNIALPLSGPALASVAIFTFLWTWDDLLGPVIYLNSDNLYTLPIALAGMKSAHRLVPWHMMMTASLYAVLPGILIFLFAQKYFVKGIVMTGNK